MTQKKKMTLAEKVAAAFEFKENSCFLPASAAPAKMIRNAISSYAQEISPEEVLAIFDATVLGSGKKGFVVTKDYIYTNHLLNSLKAGRNAKIAISSITDVKDEKKPLQLVSFKAELYDGDKIYECSIGKSWSGEPHLFFLKLDEERRKEKEAAAVKRKEAEKKAAESRKAKTGETPARKSAEEEAVRKTAEEEARKAAEEAARKAAEEAARKAAEEKARKAAEEAARKTAEETEPDIAAEEDILPSAACAEADAAYREGRLEDALSLYMTQADLGDHYAQFRTGSMFLTGEGTDESRENALYWLTIAADASYVPAIRKLASITEKETQVRYLTKAAALGDPESVWKMSRITRERAKLAEAAEKAETASRMKEAFDLYRKAAEYGDAHAQWKLADAYYEGHGCGKNTAESIYWLFEAVSGGDQDAAVKENALFPAEEKPAVFTEGIRLLHEGQKKEGLKKIRRMAYEGYPAAKRIMGEVEGTDETDPYQEGLQAFAQKKWKLAYRCFKDASPRNPEAMVMTGICEEEGLGTPKNLEKALLLYRRAYEMPGNNGDGAYRIARYLYETRPETADARLLREEEAKNWYDRAAAKGSPMALAKEEKALAAERSRKAAEDYEEALSLMERIARPIALSYPQTCSETFFADWIKLEENRKHSIEKRAAEIERLKEVLGKRAIYGGGKEAAEFRTFLIENRQPPVEILYWTLAAIERGADLSGYYNLFAGKDVDAFSDLIRHCHRRRPDYEMMKKYREVSADNVEEAWLINSIDKYELRSSTFIRFLAGHIDSERERIRAWSELCPELDHELIDRISVLIRPGEEDTSLGDLLAELMRYAKGEDCTDHADRLMRWNDPEAAVWLKRACDLGERRAMFIWSGLLRKSGRSDEARKYLILAADQHEENAVRYIYGSLGKKELELTAKEALENEHWSAAFYCYMRLFPNSYNGWGIYILHCLDKMDPGEPLRGDMIDVVRVMLENGYDIRVFDERKSIHDCRALMRCSSYFMYRHWNEADAPYMARTYEEDAARAETDWKKLLDKIQADRTNYRRQVLKKEHRNSGV